MHSLKYTPWDNLKMHWGFELTTDRYLYATVELKMIVTIRPLSVLFTRHYSGSDYLRITIGIGNGWKFNVGGPDISATQHAAPIVVFLRSPLGQNRCWTSRGKGL